MGMKSENGHRVAEMMTTVAATVLIGGTLLWAQVGSSAKCSLSGTIRDRQGKIVASAKVELSREGGTREAQTSTNDQGAYCFTSISHGRYQVRAQKEGAEASVAGVEISEGTRRQVDLVLSTRTADVHDDKPQFFDEPQFTVAGVTDTSNLGGHGSDTAVRTKNSMAGEVARLGASNENAKPASAMSDPHAGPALSGSFDENRHLARQFLDRGGEREALPYLEQAARLQPGDVQNEIDLASALLHTGQLQPAETKLKSLLPMHDTAQVHHLLAEAEEKLNRPLEAVRHYQRAAELAPDEGNLFDWGSELLLHHAAEPAIQVFSKGVREYPQSLRMRVGLGVAFYTRGSYDEALRHLSAASDLDPRNPSPYEFMGKMLSVEGAESPIIVEKMERFARLRPDSPQANYYLALSLMKRRSEAVQNGQRIESLLREAVQLDPKFDGAYFQLGVLFAERKDYQSAIDAFRTAIRINPEMGEAHYRLAQIYRQMGQTEKAAEETRVYSELEKKKAAQVERERHAIQQFVYSLQSDSAESQPKTQ
jgi:tetratricopeptide (TPR) repeat protein